MLEKKISELPEGIKWVEVGESIGAMQGMALNKLSQTYKGARRAGYVYVKDEEGVDTCLYILDGLRTRHKTDGVVRAAVAFRENGDSVEGYAIYWPEKDAAVPGKQYDLTGTS